MPEDSQDSDDSQYLAAMSPHKTDSTSNLRPIKLTPWSFLTVSWMDALVIFGAKKDLVGADLPSLPLSDTVDGCLSSFDQYKAKHPHQSLDRVVYAHILLQYAGTMCVAGILMLLSLSAGLGVPLILQQILDLVAFKDVVPESMWSVTPLPDTNGFPLFTLSNWTLAGILIALKIASTVFGRLHDTIVKRVAFQLRTLFISCVAMKALTVSPLKSGEFSKGQILNLINVDTENIVIFVTKMHELWGTLFEIVVAVCLIWRMIGFPLVAGIGVLASCLVVLTVAFIPFYGSIQLMSTTSDLRVKHIREAFEGIRLLKCQVLVETAFKNITTIRNKQLSLLNMFTKLIIFGSLIAHILSAMMPLASFSLYAARGNIMSSTIIFPALALFQMLAAPMINFIAVLAYFFNCLVSWKRIAKFLAAEDRTTLVSEKQLLGDSIHFDHATFQWPTSTKKDEVEEQTDIWRLNDVSASIKTGSLTVIVGGVGSGKTSLLSAIVGDLEKTSGSLRVQGSLTLCLQKPWIFNGTIQDNIQFGRTFNAEKMDMAIKSACFEQDLLSMPAGLMSVLGEKGVRLSGGQKARIALARAIYSDADIILLDDPLAPLDARVSHSVLQETILTALKNKTVVMTTHNHKILEHADSILFINNSGQVSQHTYSEFSKSDEYYQFTKTQNLSIESDRKTKSSHHEDSEVSDIVVAEDMEVGKVKLTTYAGYVKASGGWGHFIVMAAFIGLYQATVVLMNQWLTWWCKGTLDLGTTARIMWYIVIGCISIFLFTCYNAVIQIGVMKSVKNLHENALISVLAAPMSWWEGQLIGRLMNRFTKDIQTVENQMILLLMNLSGSVGWLVSVWVILAINTPVLLAFFIPLGVLYLGVLWYFPRTFRQLKRLEATQRSPLYSHISEMFAGVSTIVSSGGEAYWVTKMKSLLEESNQPLFFKFGAEVWILLRLELISALLVFVLAALTAKQSLFSVENLGVALLNANSLTVIMNLILQNCIAMETEMVCVERLLEYSDCLPKEDALTLESDPSDDKWPKTGTIVFRDVSAFYHSSPNVPALKNISLMIEPGSRICIAGRTGSGKSTLIASLLRFVHHTGEIIIDGHEINALGLNTLRAAFEVVPQDATLLSGTIRTWLDPLSTHTDAELWDSVFQAGLHPFLTSLNGLDTLIEENGDTFSVGQCQLLYFARILLRRPKIVLLDEATSSVDPETENLLRRLMKEKLRGTTFLTVLHRLQESVLDDYDKVLVLDQGCVVEFESPKVLVERRDSVFSGLFYAYNS